MTNPFATFLDKKSNARIMVGYHALTGRPFYLPLEQFFVHLAVWGKSGLGKTKWVEHIIRQLVDLGIGFLLLDPHGPLFRGVSRYLVRRGLADRTYVVDPDDNDVAVGLNYLESEFPGLDPVAAAVEGLARTLGDESFDQKPLLARWLPNTLAPLNVAGQTVLEIQPFLSRSAAHFRHRVLGYPGQDLAVQTEWMEYERLRPHDQDFIRQPLLNRWARLWRHTGIRRMVGQERSTIAFGEAIENGKFVLCNWGARSLAPDQKRFLNRLVLDKFLSAAERRMPDVSPPFFCIADEMGFLARGNEEQLALAVGALRKFGVHFIFLTQTMSSLRGEEGGMNLLDEVLGNCGLKASFSVSRRDAEELAADFFTGEFRSDVLNLATAQTKFRPLESTRTVTTFSESAGESESAGAGSGASAGVSFNLGTDGTTPTPDVHYSGDSESESHASGRSHSSGSSESVVPFVEFEEFREASQVLTPEQLREKFIEWIVCQPRRRLILKVAQEGPIPLLTPDVDDVFLLPQVVEQFMHRVYARCAVPSQVAETMIEERRRAFAVPANPTERNDDSPAAPSGNPATADEREAEREFKERAKRSRARSPKTRGRPKKESSD